MSKQKTKRVRIAVAIDEHGNFRAVGWTPHPATGSLAELDMKEEAHDLFMDNAHGGTMCHIIWVEADIPIPEPVTIQGTVKP